MRLVLNSVALLVGQVGMAPAQVGRVAMAPAVQAAPVPVGVILLLAVPSGMRSASLAATCKVELWKGLLLPAVFFPVYSVR